MARITICGDSMVITSKATLEDIKKLAKYRPNALELKSEDGKDVVFKVGATNGNGSINTYGASFGSASHDEKKLATITLPIPANVEDAEAYAEEYVGVAIINLNKVESQFADAMVEIKEEIAAVRDSIEVI